ncbi:MAG: PEBP family protein [Planctomycetota bacterium]
MDLCAETRNDWVIGIRTWTLGADLTSLAINQSFLISVVVGLAVVGCSGRSTLPRQRVGSLDGSVTIHGDVWADNWFALYLGDRLLVEDSVSIKTERSFNAESFSFKADYPIVLNLIAKDFKENDSGLEYIGTRKQQLGDGGLIAQFRDAATGQLIAGTNAKWQCYVIHRGPLDRQCAAQDSPVVGEGPCEFTSIDEPAGWKSIDYSTSDWSLATEFTESDVRPKDGYDRVDWDWGAKLIWSEDLEKDNTVLFRVVINGPGN